MPRLLVLVVLLVPSLAPAQEARTKGRLLYSFETPGEAAKLAKLADNAAVETVQDVGVTHGERCLRLTAKRGADYGSVRLDADAVKGWAEFDYLALDVTTSEEAALPLMVELWDGASKNYATRCTFEDVKTRPGRQTLLYHIARARRNGKEGRSWEELQPQDKIDRDALTQVKIFLTPPKDRDAVLYLDNIRLLQEDAAKPRFEVALPAGALAWKFASPGVGMKGFTTLSPKDFPDAKLTAQGDGWPDLFSGTFLVGPAGEPTTIEVKVPDGSYHYALSAGPIYRSDRLPKLLLRLGDKAILDGQPTAAEYQSRKHLLRFMDTLYSARPHALWLDFIDRMYPTHTGTIQVRDGKVSLAFRDCFLAALVLTPERQATEVPAFLEKLRHARIAAFERDLRPRPARKLDLPADRPYLAYIPDHDATIRPDSVPSDEERKRPLGYDLHVAPGERVTVRLAVAAGADLGDCTLEIARARGMPPLRVRPDIYLQNYRDDGDAVRESALLPGGRFRLEGGVTWTWWVTFVVPELLPPIWTGNAGCDVVFTPTNGPDLRVPLKLSAVPDRRTDPLPLSLGVYYSPPNGAGWDADTRKRVWLGQLKWLRGLGFTATGVGTGTVTGLNPDGTVKVTFDPTPYDLAKQAGLGVHPGQYQMGNTLPLGRAIGRRLPGSLGAKVDQQPGIELKQPGFDGYFLDACKQYRGFIEKQGLPVAVEVVDEPREVPNPWNRNLADTLAYCAMVKKAGLVGFVTPMADGNSGKDYTPLVDAADVLSVHAWRASEKLIGLAQEKKRPLWFYNTGMDRLSWGFYPWRAGATGRWEWHFYFPEDQAKGGYPGREPYNPFTGSHGLTSPGPLAEPGAMRFQSAFLTASEGVTDWAYLLTLEQRVKEAEAAGKHAEVVMEAKAFLAALNRAIPAIPGSKNLLTEADGPLVGMGLTDEARRFTPQWRRTIAGLLVRLQ